MRVSARKGRVPNYPGCPFQLPYVDAEESWGKVREVLSPYPSKRLSLPSAHLHPAPEQFDGVAPLPIVIVHHVVAA